jgi:hypothetical protein
MPHNNNSFFFGWDIFRRLNALKLRSRKKKKRKKSFIRFFCFQKNRRKWVESLRVEVLKCRKWLEITFSLFVAKKKFLFDSFAFKKKKKMGGVFES